MTPLERIASIIDSLENARRRPGMFIKPVDGTAALNFVAGIFVGTRELGIGERHHEAWWEVQETRGWKRHPQGPISQMEERGFTDEEMADEILAIEIDTWKLLQAAM